MISAGVPSRMGFPQQGQGSPGLSNRIMRSSSLFSPPPQVGPWHPWAPRPGPRPISSYIMVSKFSCGWSIINRSLRALPSLNFVNGVDYSNRIVRARHGPAHVSLTPGPCTLRAVERRTITSPAKRIDSAKYVLCRVRKRVMLTAAAAIDYHLLAPLSALKRIGLVIFPLPQFNGFSAFRALNGRPCIAPAFRDINQHSATGFQRIPHSAGTQM